ncbi:hypothetical protein COMA2_10102 [Candidatus Nitrospira nitrificans]|uniref:Uncharacterized protein n=1 Tax=Candidatus Nitrospira nitrificans TaxID=1742973 RepID=A0A0S4L2K9_9BACT|nr:hypothetical protein COMA2_10102 [Candidatus Nitrospira nitrificans]
MVRKACAPSLPGRRKGEYLYDRDGSGAETRPIMARLQAGEVKTNCPNNSTTITPLLTFAVLYWAAFSGKSSTSWTPNSKKPWPISRKKAACWERSCCICAS